MNKSRRTMLKLSVALAALALLFVPLSLRADSDDPPDDREFGAIIGVVYDAERNPVAEAGVALLDSNRVFIERVTTNRRGQFRFSQVPAGDYLLAASKRGVGEARANVRVEAGQIARVQMVLRYRP